MAALLDNTSKEFQIKVLLGDGRISPLHWASQFGCLEVARILLSRAEGIDQGLKEKILSGKDACNGNTPLHVASLDLRNARIVKLLIWNGANLRAQNNQGLNPYEFATKTNQSQIKP